MLVRLAVPVFVVLEYLAVRIDQPGLAFFEGFHIEDRLEETDIVDHLFGRRALVSGTRSRNGAGRVQEQDR